MENDDAISKCSQILGILGTSTDKRFPAVPKLPKQSPIQHIPLTIDVSDWCASTPKVLVPGSADSGITMSQVDNVKNPFTFEEAFVSQSLHETHEALLLDASLATVVPDIDTHITIQKSICLNATSIVEHDESDGESMSPALAPLLQCKCSRNASRTSDDGTTKVTIVLSKCSITQPSSSFPCHMHCITNDYRITHEVLGIGESGKVMACYNKQTNLKYALKVLRDGVKARREVGLHYLVSSHENVLTIVDIYDNTFGGVKCLLVIVEFVLGGDLLTRFENQGSRAHEEKVVSEVIRQVGSAVKYLHDMNIAHRDIKLENILCSTNGTDCIYKLADFGFAKRPERNDLMRSPCCTPFYVAPEILAREQYDKSCDMWALGVVTYILLCGYPPFYSMKGIPLSPGMKTRIASGCYAFPAAEWDYVSQGTKNVIKHLLITDPSARATIDDLMMSVFVGGNYSTPFRNGPSNDPEDPEAEGLVRIKETSVQIPRSVRFLEEGVKAPRLHSIQEEVGRAMDAIRLGNDTCFIKQPRLSCNSLLTRRKTVMSKSLANGTFSIPFAKASAS